MRILFATQAIDLDDPNLAQTVDMVRALAERCSSVVVLCDRVARHDLPGNVSFRTFGARSRLGRGLRFQAALARTVREATLDALLAHMVPEFLVLAAPVAKPARVPLLLWYTHPRASGWLRAAERLCDVALSVDERAVPLESSKVRGIGHAIDLARFQPRTDAPDAGGPLRLLALGRTEPRKALPTVLDAVERAVAAGVDIDLEIRGPSVNERERRHRAALAERIGTSDVLRARATLADPVPRDRLGELMRARDAVVSATRGETQGGALDKVVYEAAACAVPVIACNPHLDGLLAGLPVELRFRGGDPDDLARALRSFAAADPDARAEAGRELRRRVEAGHSVDTWADGVLRVVSGLGRRGRPLDS
jgi:glycosyltransferase involved in cell wall biosynthesis